ncbi:MAG: saccharopine dehydrogenase family protein [Flavobacteriales bacterium]|jgi:saccharopine dehydrogenase-like NADP-dependent oxidoreductase
MKKILLIGAGRSSAHLIRYLIQHAESENWFIRVGDMDVASAERKIAGSKRAEAFALNASDADMRRREIAAADLVISMLPATMHVEVAKDCIAARKNVITPSYVADQMWPLHEEAKQAGVLILNEMGVDPGIDHMSAMRIIDGIKASGGRITSFESYTGGLVAPESDDNPWHYKITWNPRNVVLAGYGGTARFRQHGELKYIPYNHLFRRITPVEVPGYGRFEGYANRDSLKYTSVYGLDGIGTLLRGTLRKDGFCSSWQALVDLGLTDDSFQLENPQEMTWRQLTSSFTSDPLSANLEKDLQQRFGWTDEVMSRLKWLGIFEENPLGITNGTPAEALQKCIEEKWKLGPADKDLLVMWHRFVFEQDGKQHEITSWLTSEGEDPVYTAMSRTVGLPIAIAARHILRGDWKMTGIVLPVTPDIYHPVLNELETMDVKFHEQHLVIG